MRLAMHVRSVLSLLLIGVLFLAGALVQRLVVWPAAHLWPARRWAIVSVFMRAISAGIFAILRLGGARARRHGRIPTGSAVLVVMNHQSLLDIPTVVLLSRPHSPAFVTRRLYTRFVPVVALCTRLIGCPAIEPRSRRQALREIENAARMQDHGLLIFPEGHRTPDGEVQPWRTAGLEAMLRARAMPVYLVVTDGFWRTRRLSDFVWNVAAIDGITEVLGPFDPPPDPAALPEFAAGLRARMVERLRALREGRRDAA
jgi:1-acyl-sn-glycerol-3-phosphate acyltransferase